MPLLLNPPETSTVSTLPEYVSRIEEEAYDLDDTDQLIDSAKHLRRLANNKSLLVEHVSNELRDIVEFERTNLYGPQVFLLHTCPDYFLRANIWLTQSRIEDSISGFQYDVCHDHNFDILTAGYFGPGYRSKTYTYDYGGVAGYLGEPVEMVEHPDFTLREGMIALYRAKEDIHRQIAPKSLSISLNVIPRSDKINEPQFQFDERTRSINRFLHSSGSELVVRMASVFSNGSTADLLASIYQDHPNAHLRGLAAASLSKVEPDAKIEIANHIAADRSASTQRIFRSEMERCGSSLNLLGRS